MGISVGAPVRDAAGMRVRPAVGAMVGAVVGIAVGVSDHLSGWPRGPGVRGKPTVDLRP